LFCGNEKLHWRGQAFAKRGFARGPSATGLCPVAGLEFFRLGSLLRQLAVKELTEGEVCDILDCLRLRFAAVKYKWRRSVKDREYGDSSLEVDQKLIAEGLEQLAGEIKVLETWLRELDATAESEADGQNEASKQNEENLAVRKSYTDMLRSRREMLDSLQKQAR